MLGGRPWTLDVRTGPLPSVRLPCRYGHQWVAGSEMRSLREAGTKVLSSVSLSFHPSENVGYREATDSPESSAGKHWPPVHTCYRDEMTALQLPAVAKVRSITAAEGDQ